MGASVYLFRDDHRLVHIIYIYIQTVIVLILDL